MAPGTGLAVPLNLSLGVSMSAQRHLQTYHNHRDLEVKMALGNHTFGVLDRVDYPDEVQPRDSFKIVFLGPSYLVYVGKIYTTSRMMEAALSRISCMSIDRVDYRARLDLSFLVWLGYWTSQTLIRVRAMVGSLEKFGVQKILAYQGLRGRDPSTKMHPKVEPGAIVYPIDRHTRYP